MLSFHTGVKPAGPGHGTSERLEHRLDIMVPIGGFQEIEVEVETGVVTLTGTVPTYHAHAEAYNAAMNTVGVVEVHNNITVA